MKGSPVLVMIRYKVKPGQVERNLALLRAVYDEMNASQPDGVRYATYQLPDQVSFVQFAEVGPEGPAALHHQPEPFRRYRETLEERCDEPPVMTVLNEVGSYRFSGGGQS